MHIIITGNPADGFRHIGPVTPNSPELEEYIASELAGRDWWLVEVTPLKEQE